MRQHELELPYPVGTGNHSVRHSRGRHYLTAGAKRYRAMVVEAAHRAGLAGRRMAGPLHVHVLAAPPDRRARDADNLLKVLKDAITLAGVWKDDSNKVIDSTALEWTDPVQGGALLVTIQEGRE